MILRGFLAFSLILSTALFASSAFASGDAKKGKKVFNKCKACHTVKANKHKIGPSLAGIVGRDAGKAAGFKKYKGLKTADWKWDEAALDGWLKNPKKWLKAKNGNKSAMVYKLKKEKDRANLIAYLKSK
ncbi:MAG: c-type cytochrome [Rhodospirillales bacterium]